jgi:FAS-associated factor 2
MSSEGFCDYINQNFIFYGIDISSKQGYSLSYQIKATTYPFLAIISVIKSKTQVMKTFEGDMEELDILIGNLIELQDTIEAQLIVERDEQNVRNASVREREEQDRNFREIQQKDLQKQKEKEEREKRQKEEKEAKMKRELEAKQQEELKAKQKIQTLNAVKVERENLKKNFPQEPENSKETTLIKFKFPDGSQKERRFLRTDKNILLYQFIHILDSESNSWFPKETSTLDHYELMTSFPKKKLDPNQTLKEANCIPNATLFVRNTNESSDDEEEEESIE